MEYKLLAQKYTVRIPKVETPVHYFEIRVYKGEDIRTWPKLLVLIQAPCRSTLYKLITGLMFNWNWNWEKVEVRLTEEETKIFLLFQYKQKDYKLLGKAFETLRTQGPEAAREFLLKRYKVEQLRRSLEVKG